jgi:hypothetical protein
MEFLSGKTGLFPSSWQRWPFSKKVRRWVPRTYGVQP